MGLSTLAMTLTLAMLAQGAVAPHASSQDASSQDAGRIALGAYLRCQQAAARELDDGRSPEDAVATRIELRCETQYQAYRQAWGASGGAGAPDQRTWGLDNMRQAMARGAVHSHRRATAAMADLKACVARVVAEQRAQPLDAVVDESVRQCGGLIPFPVAPGASRDAITAEQARDRKDRHDGLTRSLISGEVRRSLTASHPVG